MAFDTLAYAQRLKAAGVAEEQAEAQALRDAVTETAVSKANLEAGFARIDGRMDLLETRTDEPIQASEARIDELFRALEARQEAANVRRDVRMKVFIVAVAALAVAAAKLIP